jgi:enoyl-CoA hydratase
MLQQSENNGVTTLTMQHGKANALDLEFCRALADKFSELREANQAVVLTGTGGIFSAGVDLKRILSDGPEYIREFLHSLNDLCKTLLEFDNPLVAAINGHAIAGGCVIAQACDMRIMAGGKGRIGVPELQVGVPFPSYVIEVLRLGFPSQVFAKLAYAGETYTPETALELQIIDQVDFSEELLTIAHERAQRMAAHSHAAFSLSKRQRNAVALGQGESNQREFGAEIERVWLSDETRKRISDYVERVLGG